MLIDPYRLENVIFQLLQALPLSAIGDEARACYELKKIVEVGGWHEAEKAICQRRG
jgi:hypothetical protein